MKKIDIFRFVIFSAILGVLIYTPGKFTYGQDQAAPETSGDQEQGGEAQTNVGDNEGKESNEAIEVEPKEEKPAAEKSKSNNKKKKRIFSGEEAFIAGSDWEFDGFVVGGQDQEVKSMFVVNDLIYLNVGLSHGFKPGDRLGIYRRSTRIRDPQSGRFLGYQVKRIATVEVTNKIEDETSSVRVISSHTGIEIGDLVRRDR